MWGKVVVFVRAKCLPETRYGSQKEGEESPLPAGLVGNWRGQGEVELRPGENQLSQEAGLQGS